MKDLNRLIRYLAYTLELLVLFMVQETPGLLPAVAGVRPVLLLPAAVAIAMFEEEVPALAFGIDSPDRTAVFYRTFKYSELTVSYHLRHVMKLHAETDIRLIGTIAVHRLLPGHPRDRKFNIKSQYLFKELG